MALSAKKFGDHSSFVSDSSEAFIFLSVEKSAEAIRKKDPGSWLSALILSACSGGQGGLDSSPSPESQFSGRADRLESSQSFVERPIAYGFYELASPIKEGKATAYATELEGVNNPNPLAICGEAEAMNASLKDAGEERYLGAKVCGFFLKYRLLSLPSEDESMVSVSFLGETLSSVCFGDEISVQGIANALVFS